jgi:hypothetical protein
MNDSFFIIGYIENRATIVVRANTKTTTPKNEFPSTDFSAIYTSILCIEEAMTDSDTIAAEIPGATKLDWNSSIELMMARWCDQAKSFEWMHTEAYSQYNKKAKIIMITSNILTAVSGLSNVIAGGYAIDGFQLAWVFGSLSIMVSITNMLQEKLGYLTKAADHRNYTTQWGTIRRKIDEELSIPPQSRKDCGTFLKYLRQDINQVSIAGNSAVPESIRKSCYEKFSHIPDFDLPDICGHIEHTRVYFANDNDKAKEHLIS